LAKIPYYTFYNGLFKAFKDILKKQRLIWESLGKRSNNRELILFI
jgi:hypothetical protein